MNWLLDLYPSYPAPGTVVWIRAYLLFRHKGIVSDRWCDGKPLVITNDPVRGVIEQTWEEFCAGQTPQVEGYPSRLPYHEVLQRARSRLGERYHLFDFNCDQLKNYAHALPALSEQVQIVAVTAAIAGVAVAMAAKKR